MSRRIINGSTIIVVLLSFVISTMPVSTPQVGNNGDLRSAISHIQDLSRPDTSSRSFRIVLTHTLSSLQSAAELNTLLTRTDNSSDEKKTTITVSIKLPYLLANSYTIEGGAFFSELLPSFHHSIYQSHTTVPELPPPITLA